MASRVNVANLFLQYSILSWPHNFQAFVIFIILGAAQYVEQDLNKR
jgi:hypothetical protein